MPVKESAAASGAAIVPSESAAMVTPVPIPAYLRETYTWAYLHPFGVWFFDRPWIVSAILWGNYDRLIETALAEVEPGQSVLQAACVYGGFSPRLAARLGATGRLDLIDVAPIQLANARRKLTAYDHVHLQICNAVAPPAGPYETVISFFLLHEVPDDDKSRIVDALLARVAPGGRAVFVDYHEPRWWHPLRPLMWAVFGLLEPFAPPLWRRDLRSFANEAAAEAFTWRTETLFGGLYQKTVAIRRT